MVEKRHSSHSCRCCATPGGAIKANFAAPSHINNKTRSLFIEHVGKLTKFKTVSFGILPHNRRWACMVAAANLPDASRTPRDLHEK